MAGVIRESVSLSIIFCLGTMIVNFNDPWHYDRLCERVQSTSLLSLGEAYFYSLPWIKVAVNVLLLQGRSAIPYKILRGYL